MIAYFQNHTKYTFIKIADSPSNYVHKLYVAQPFCFCHCQQCPNCSLLKDSCCQLCNNSHCIAMTNSNCQQCQWQLHGHYIRTIQQILITLIDALLNISKRTQDHVYLNMAAGSEIEVALTLIVLIDQNQRSKNQRSKVS